MNPGVAPGSITVPGAPVSERASVFATPRLISPPSHWKKSRKPVSVPSTDWFETLCPHGPEATPSFAFRMPSSAP